MITREFLQAEIERTLNSGDVKEKLKLLGAADVSGFKVWSGQYDYGKTDLRITFYPDLAETVRVMRNKASRLGIDAECFGKRLLFPINGREEWGYITDIKLQNTRYPWIVSLDNGRVYKLPTHVIKLAAIKTMKKTGENPIKEDPPEITSGSRPTIMSEPDSSPEPPHNESQNNSSNFKFNFK